MASYYETLLRRIENVDVGGKTDTPFNKMTGPGGTALATPDGRVFGTSNYAPPTPAEQAYKSIAAPVAMTSSAAIPAAPVIPQQFGAAAGVASVSGKDYWGGVAQYQPIAKFAPGDFGGKQAVGSADWWSDNRGNQAVVAPGANTSEAQALLTRQREMDRIEEEAIRRASGSTRVGGEAKPAGLSRDQKILQAGEQVVKDNAQLDQREAVVTKGRDQEKLAQSQQQQQTQALTQMQEIMKQPGGEEAVAQWYEQLIQGKNKNKSKDKKEKS